MRVVITTILLFSSLGLAACERAGPAERAGRSLDRTGERVRDAIDPPGPTERVGRAVDRAVR